jgi:hypothetical protein
LPWWKDRPAQGTRCLKSTMYPQIRGDQYLSSSSWPRKYHWGLIYSAMDAPSCHQLETLLRWSMSLPIVYTLNLFHCKAFRTCRHRRCPYSKY